MSEAYRLGLLLLLLLPAVAAAQRDPTMPPGYGETMGRSTTDSNQTNPLRLFGILNGPGGGSAIINGRRVRAGESIDGVRVISVGNDSVTIERGGNPVLIRMLPQVIKHPASPAAMRKK